MKKKDVSILYTGTLPVKEKEQTLFECFCTKKIFFLKVTRCVPIWGVKCIAQEHNYEDDQR